MTDATYILSSEAARILHCGPDNVRRLDRIGALKAVIKTAGGVRLFSRGEVERFAAARARARDLHSDEDRRITVPPPNDATQRVVS